MIHRIQTAHLRAPLSSESVAGSTLPLNTSAAEATTLTHCIIRIATPSRHRGCVLNEPQVASHRQTTRTQFLPGSYHPRSFPVASSPLGPRTRTSSLRDADVSSDLLGTVPLSFCEFHSQNCLCTVKRIPRAENCSWIRPISLRKSQAQSIPSTTCSHFLGLAHLLNVIEEALVGAAGFGEELFIGHGLEVELCWSFWWWGRWQFGRLRRSRRVVARASDCRHRNRCHHTHSCQSSPSHAHSVQTQPKPPQKLSTSTPDITQSAANADHRAGHVTGPP